MAGERGIVEEGRSQSQKEGKRTNDVSQPPTPVLHNTSINACCLTASNLKCAHTHNSLYPELNLAGLKGDTGLKSCSSTLNPVFRSWPVRCSSQSGKL